LKARYRKMTGFFYARDFWFKSVFNGAEITVPGLIF